MDKLLNIFVKIYKSKYNHLVTIGTDVYEMSTDAHAPNGVNMYCGEVEEYDIDPANEIPLSDVSDSMKLAIVERIEWQYNYMNELD